MSDTPGKEAELCVYLCAVVGTRVSFCLETTYPATVFVTRIHSVRENLSCIIEEHIHGRVSIRK